MIPTRNTVILSNDFENEIEILKNNINLKNLVIFNTIELRSSAKNEKTIDDKKYIYVKNIIEEAYISSMDKKYIAILAQTFSIEAQNALLKIMEEPPHNIIFLLYANNKNKILSTIHSRMIMIDKRIKKNVKDFALDLKTLNIAKIYQYMLDIEKQNINFNEAKDIVHSILHCASKNMNLNAGQLKRFEISIDALNKKSDVNIVLLPLLLSLLPQN